MDFKLYLSLEGLNELEADWCRLAEQVPDVQFYQLAYWYKSYLQVLHTGAQSVFFVAAYEQGEISFVLPLQCVTENVLGVKAVSLQLPTHPHMSLLDGLVSEMALSPSLLSELLVFLNQQKGLSWDWLYFRKVSEKSSLQKIFNSPENKKNIFVRADSESYFIDCEKNVDDALSHLSSKFRRNVRRQERNAASLGELHFESLQGDSLLSCLDEFLILEASGWKGQADSAILCHEKIVSFYKLIIKYQNPQNKCAINVLRLDGKLIAAQFSIINGSTMNLLKIAYDEKLAKIAPGNVLLLKVIQYCTESKNIHQLCFVTGPKWAEKWKSGKRNICVFQLFNKTFKGQLARFLLMTKRRLQKNINYLDNN